MSPKRLAVVTTHPIQYQSPWFRALAEHSDIDLEVLYCHQATPQEQASAGFNVEFDWDVSLLDGYPHRFLRNVARKPSLNGFAGLDTPQISDIVKAEDFDAVIVNGWNYKSAWQAMRACWRTKTPVMVRSDSHLHTERSLPKKVAKLPLYRWFIPKADACCAVGTWSRDYFLHYGARPERVFIVPHVVDVDFFRKEAGRLRPQRTELRREWQLDEAATVFLFAGKFVEKKRPLDFINAIAGANKNAKTIMGLMVGNGPLRQVCEDAVKTTNAPIRFAGFLNQSKMPTAYAAADALVLPSDGGETWGLVINEAMASGKPCLVSDRVGCGPDLIVAGETGDVFPVGDIAALASLLGSYADGRSALTGMGAKAEQEASRYSIGAAVEGVMDAIKAVSNGTRN
ncbi:MAG TPA: glycosyltransferase family 4 protein [Pyrinomonadaceae bacterium]|nr:glycosyltransferase family 4 protein [Pyrinomonadaceae bacterium]